MAVTPVAVIDNFLAPTLSFAVSLGRRSIPLHIYGRGAGRWSRFCTRRLACPPVEDAQQFVPWLERRVRSGEITRIAPTSDLLAYYASFLRDAFPRDVQRTIAPLVEIENCLIKTRFAAACARIGQPTPTGFAPDDPDAALAAALQAGFPLILKPKSHLVVGSHERGRVVRGARAFRAAYQKYPCVPGQQWIAERYPELLWPLVQRYVPSARRRVFSVSGIKDADGGIVTASLSVKRWQWPPDIGTSTSQLSYNNSTILAAGARAVDQLISRGIFELELLVDRSELLAIDLNPRAFGFMTLDLALGNDLPWLWYRSTHRPLHALPVPEARPLLEARFSVPHTIGRAVGRLLGRQSPKSARSRRPAIAMLGHWSDPLPMLLSNAQLLRHPGGLIRPYVTAAMAEKTCEPDSTPSDGEQQPLEQSKKTRADL